jgi:arsenate reductase-like glutaredoxin family protein
MTETSAALGQAVGILSVALASDPRAVIFDLTIMALFDRTHRLADLLQAGRPALTLSLRVCLVLALHHNLAHTQTLDISAQRLRRMATTSTMQCHCDLRTDVTSMQEINHRLLHLTARSTVVTIMDTRSTVKAPIAMKAQVTTRETSLNFLWRHLLNQMDRSMRHLLSSMRLTSSHLSVLRYLLP